MLISCGNPVKKIKTLAIFLLFSTNAPQQRTKFSTVYEIIAKENSE